MSERKDDLPPLTTEGQRWQLVTKVAFGVFCLALVGAIVGGIVLKRPEVVMASGITGVLALVAVGLCSSRIRG